MIREVTNCLGNTIRLHQIVTHHEGWKGRVVKIREPHGAGPKIYVDPLNPADLPPRQTRLIDGPDGKMKLWLRPLEHGAGMGNFVEACEEDEDNLATQRGRELEEEFDEE